MNTASTEVMDLIKVASTFPQPPTPNIRRENMVTTIAEMLKSETEVVIVEGPDGIGKTTLLAQFAEALPHHVLSLFVRSSSRWAYDSTMLTRDLCDQIGWALTRERYRSVEELDSAQLLSARIFNLQRQANSMRATYYFVVDGLSEIPEEDSHEREMILKLLPFGIPCFRFLLSGPLDSLKSRPQKVRGISTFRLAGFTFEETRQFFHGLLDDATALEVHKATKMVPGNLASVRRRLQSGTKVQRVLEELPESLPDFFELEWRVVQDDEPLLRQALAILAFDGRRHSLDSLSRLCNIEPATLEKMLTRCTFVERRNECQTIEFVCDVFKRFAAKRLSPLRRSVLNMAISELMSSSESTEALTHLPGFLHQAERYEELLNYLSPSHIGRLIDCGESWIPLHQKAELGVDTALRLQRDGDLLRFGLQRATIASMESSQPWRSEVEAYAALEDFCAAYALAQRMVTKEDRLHLLAVIARAKKTKSLPIEVELNEQIQQLYRLLDRGSLGDRGVEIASDLLYTHPELAVELVQDCMGGDGPENRLDLALARLSFKALMEKQDGTAGMDSTQQALRARVKDPIVQKFMDTTSLFFGGYSAEAVIAEVDKWEKACDRVFTLRAWAVANATRRDAGAVVEYALNTILKTTAYTANAKVYQELASPLVYIPDLEQAKAIIRRLDGLRGTIASAGPTVEYVTLQTTLAEAENRYDRQASSDRLQSLFFDVDALTEPATRLAALALLARVLKKVDPDKEFEPEGGIHYAVVTSLRAVVTEVLASTADHYVAVRPAIAALARSDTRIAFEVISQLNTAPRREAALVQFLEAVTAESSSIANFAVIDEAYAKLKSIPMRAEASRVVLRSLLRQRKDLTPFLPRVIALRHWVKGIPDAEERCQALCMLLEILLDHKTHISSSLLDSLSQELEEAWNALDAGWSKVDVGFKIVALMAKCCPDVSRRFLAKTEKVRNEIVLDCRDTAMSYIGCVRLALRSFAGLLKRRLYTDPDLEALKELIDRIPAIAVRATAWSELALKFFMVHEVKQCQEIVSERVRPLLESEAIVDEETRWKVIVTVSPALFRAHAVSAKQLIDKLPQPYRDDAYGEICTFIITKRLPMEAYDPAGNDERKVTYEDFLDVCGVLQCVETDHVAYWQMESLVDHIQKRFRSEYNNTQIADILQQLRSLAATKFPNPEHIQHEGYKILAEAQISRLDRAKGGWDDFAKRARAIPNVADSAFVLMGIGAAMPPKDIVKAVAFLQEAKNLIPQIATFEDRCGRYEILAKLSADLDKRLCKECLRQAWTEAKPLEPADVPKARRRLIDFAHRLDPEFAASLASESDDDPGRETARAQARQRLELLRLRERVAAADGNAIKAAQDVEQHVEVAGLMLAGLNSNRVSTVHIDFTRQFIKQASRMNVQDAYVVLSWVIENAVRRYSDTEHASIVLRPLYEAARLSAELAFRIAARIRSITDSGISFARSSGSSGASLIRPGEREKALAILREWASTAIGFIMITDPYFGPEELNMIKLIRTVNLGIPVSVLTSRKHQQDVKVQQPWDDAYQSHWRLNLSDCAAGEVRIVVVGKGSAGEHPIHDRWWLTKGGGLRVGTSANSLGISKLSEVTPMTEAEATSRVAEVERYLNALVRDDNAERLNYQQFWL